MKDKFIGCLVGAAIGDALGMPLEDVPRKKAEKYYPNGINDFTDPHREALCRGLKAAQHTDDTLLMIALCESLVEKKKFDPGHFAGKLKKCYKRNYDNDKRYWGDATKAAIKNLLSGKNWQESGVDKAGCGGSTRAAPLGLFYFRDFDNLVEFSKLQCHITHTNQVAKDGAVCIAATVSYLLENKKNLINSLFKFVKTKEFKEKLDQVENALSKGCDDSRAIAILGNSYMAPDVVGLALFIFLSEPMDFQKAVLRAANATGEGGGDTDSIAFLVGAFSGAYNGINRIRRNWVKRVENSQLLRDLAERIYEITVANFTRR